MTDEHDGRAGFGNRLRRLREDAELSGKELAERLGWPASKVSRLENGRQTASAQDVRAWAEAVDTTAEVRDELVADLRSLRVEYATWRRQLRTGFAPVQRAHVVLSHATTHLRSMTTAIVPGLLQTTDYARHMFSGVSKFDGEPKDVEEAVRSRMRRQEVLYDPEHKFQFLMTEGALRARLCPPAVLRAQLDRLLVLSGLENVELAVIPFSTRLPIAADHGFAIFDDTLVLVETIGAELAIRDRDDIVPYERTFNAFWDVALHGQEAFDFIAALALELTPPSR
ncbi:helix-turn-helix domain-containing protein [Pseudonocardia acaciae]|uniref:helix-turn-helix domain-containing protein n=1 Tax=Pseudonocardia acaciae TaxID=551276 RepID=UPI00048BA26A|nr:helix-turn-helix transcriptional regulator [Pseudonocardia acaciae]